VFSSTRPWTGADLAGRFQLRFIVRNSLICACIGALYFATFMFWNMREGVRAGGACALRALQARMPPAFPVNSIERDRQPDPHAPNEAENASRPATWFRPRCPKATGCDAGEELDLARLLRIEQLRLGSR